MDIKSFFSNRDNCTLAAKISAYVGIVTSIVGVVLSAVEIAKKKRGETIPKGLTAIKSVFLVFSVAGAIFGTLFSEKVFDEEDTVNSNLEE